MLKRNCKICGKEFLVELNVIKNGNGKFCGRRCFRQWVSKHSIKVKRKCEICDKEFSIYPSDVKRGRGKCCSLQCVGLGLLAITE
jgi:E3 ubiquitin-protein ligase DOA10